MNAAITAIVLVAGTLGTGISSSAVSIGRQSAIDEDLVEICGAVAVSPRHAVTLHAFTERHEVFLLSKGSRVFPDSVLHFRDMGLSALVFEDSVFTAYDQPRNTRPPNGSALLILAVHPTGMFMERTFPLEELSDGALLLASPPSPELMGAPVFDSNNALAGIITGSYNPGQGRGELLALVPGSLWHFWVETFLSRAGMNTTPFGVTAMPATTGLSPVQGVLILQVERTSVADSIGLLEGDIITHADGERLYHPEALKTLLQTAYSEVVLSVRRGSSTLELIVPR